MSDRVLKVALYSIGSTLLILIITIPLIAMLWISGIQYHSRWNILFFIAMITIFDLLAEYIGRMTVDGFATLFSWTRAAYCTAPADVPAWAPSPL